jgi:hypothetical protein
MSLTEQAQRVVKKNNEIDGAITEILMRNLGLIVAEGETKPDVGLMAWGTMAVEVGLALANLFLAIKNPDQHRTYRAICDLTYQLASNDFWQKNAAVLMPVVHSALNAYRDSASLLLERESRGEYSSNDALIAGARTAPLELFPLIAYLVGGPKLMVSASIPLKTELGPYFLN